MNESLEFLTFDELRLAGLCYLCVTAAVVGGVAAAGSVASSAIGASAAKDASKTQAKAAEQAQQQSQQMYDTTRADLAPYRDVGEQAKGQYMNLLGLGPGGTEGMTSALAATPGYQFSLQQGLQATQAGYASHGLAMSGASLKGAANYAEGLAGTTYQSILGNYYNAMQLGEQASAQTGQFGTELTGQENQATMQAGAASAAGTVGAANATIGGINSTVAGLSNALLTPAMFQAMAGGGGLYGGGGMGGGFAL